MRSLRLSVVCALAVLGSFAPAAAADGGAAACSTPVTVSRAQQLEGLALERGRYTVTILDSSELSCDEAIEDSAHSWELPAPSFPRAGRSNRVRAPSSAATGPAASRSRTPPRPPAAAGLSWDSIQDWVIVWLPIIFMGLIAVVLIMTLRYMPRTKPQEIKPQSSSSVRWHDVAGWTRPRTSCARWWSSCAIASASASGAKVPKGILLHGPPGTGKALLAKAVANEAEAKFFAQSASSFVEMFAGLGAARIGRLFRRARKEAPAIVFIDELDAVGATRGKDISGEKDQTLNQLLVELDGFGTADNVVVIAASNLLDKLDPALLRPGRFDRQILVSAPDLKGRRAILDVHTRGMPLEPGLDLDLIARQTSNLTGADLANICNEAAIFAGRDHRETIGARLPVALERVIAGMQSRRVITEHEKRVVAYHEAGHALCSELLPSVEKVHRISIIPRGRALGYTLNLPEEDRYLKTRDELLDYMVVLLGGRVTDRVRADHHRRRGRSPEGPRDQPLDDHAVRHGHRVELEAGAHRRLLDV